MTLVAMINPIPPKNAGNTPTKINADATKIDLLIDIFVVIHPDTNEKIHSISDGMELINFTVSPLASGNAFAISANAGVVILVVYIRSATHKVAALTAAPYFFPVLSVMFKSPSFYKNLFRIS